MKQRKKAEAANKEVSQSKEKTAEAKKAAAQAESGKTEAEGEFSEIEVKNDVAKGREADEEHPGHRTQANEEAGSIVLHVEQDMDERKKTAISNEEACREGEVMMEHKREETNEKQTENVIETHCSGEELPERRTQIGRFYRVFVGHDMNEEEKDDRLNGAVCCEDEFTMDHKQEETNEAAAAKKYA